MKTNKTYTFAVPCSYVYEIEAETQEKAKEILMEKGGWDISGDLCLESEDYKNATCLDGWFTTSGGDATNILKESDCTKAEKSKMQVIAYYETKNNNYAERVAEFANEELYEVCIKVLEKDAESHNMILTESIDDTTVCERADAMQMASDYINEDDYTVCEKADVENALNSFLNKEKQQ